METIDDILREMRYGMIPKHRQDREFLWKYADRIEAAMKAECEELHKRIKLWSDRADELRKKCDEQYAVIKQDLTTEKTSAVGNAAKMSEALNMLLGVFDSGLVEYSDSCDNSDTAQIQYVIDKAVEALSAPATATATATATAPATATATATAPAKIK